MTNKGFWYAGALIVAISSTACAVTGGGGGEPIRLAQADFKYDITKAADLKIITTTRASCNPAGNGVCPINIAVQDGCSKHAPKDNPKIVPDVEQLVIPKERQGRPVAIVWKVASPWKFDAPGIKFYAATGEFRDYGNQMGSWVHVDLATTRDVYPYEINVVNSKTGERCKGDPTIFNDF